MEFRFGSGKGGQAARILSAISNLVVVIGMIIYFAVGTGKFLSIFLPFSPAVCSIIMITIGIIYTTMSGLYGVVYTDIIQAFIILIAAVYISLKAMFLPNHDEVVAFAGEKWSSIIPNWTAEPMHWLHQPDVYSLFGICIMFWIMRGIFEGAGGFIGGYMPQRYYASKGPKTAGLLTAEWVVLLSTRWPMIIGLALLGMSLALSNQEIATLLNNDPEKTLPVVIGVLMPVGMKGIVIAGLIAAAMSTFDSTVNAGASYWVKDIYQRYINPSANTKKLVHQSYYASIAIGLIGAIIAFSVHNINEIWSWITGSLSAGLFGPILLRWYWWRFNGIGFAVSTGVGLTASILAKLLLHSWPFYLTFALVLSVSIIAGIIASYLTPAVDEEVLNTFYKKIKPFGLWKPQEASCKVNFLSKIKSEHVRDFVNVIVAICWHLSMFLFFICLVLWKWEIVIPCLFIVTVTSIILYFNWYKYLSDDDYQEEDFPEGEAPLTT
jgi:Na+/proline symporter